MIKDKTVKSKGMPIKFDEDGEPYIVTPFTIPIANTYIELEDSTYGIMQGVRTYLQCAVEFDNDGSPVIYP